MKKRDAKNEVPANFGDLMNIWSLESICCTTMNVRLGILKEDNEKAKRLIKVALKSSFLWVILTILLFSWFVSFSF